MNETFWDAQNLEIVACANSDDFSGSGINFRPGKNFVDWMLWVVGGTPFGEGDPPIKGGVIPRASNPRNFLGSVIFSRSRENISDSEFSLEICACLNLDAKSVPEALV